MSRNPKSLPVSADCCPLNGFFSPLARAIELAPVRLNGSRGEVWTQWLKANAAKLGVKADELEWSGVLDYLDAQSGRPLHGHDIAAILSGHGGRVFEVVLQGDPSYAEWLSKRYGVTIEEAEDLPEYDDDVVHAEFCREFRRTRHEGYTMAGARNYQEVLLTYQFAEPQRPYGYLVYEMECDDGVRYFARTPQTRSQAFLTRGEADKELLRMTGGLADFRASLRAYQSGHWEGISNVLLHIRLDDLTDTDGKRVLFVEEIQSDWGADGRRLGFGDTAKFGKIRQAMSPFEQAIDRSDADAVSALNDMPEYSALAESARRVNPAGKIPAAPYVTKTDAWLSLAIKKIFVIAVTEGYERVAFVTGQQAADRFKLASAGLDGGLQKTSADGMRVFYDQMLLQSLTKLLQRSGGGSIDRVNIGTNSNQRELWGDALQGGLQPGFEVTQRMRDVVSRGMPLFSLAAHSTSQDDGGKQVPPAVRERAR